MFSATVPREEEILLHDDAQLPVQRVGRDVADLELVDQQPARAGQIELGDQVDDGRFAAARVADERDRLPRLGGEVDVAQHGPLGVVGETDVAGTRRGRACVGSSTASGRSAHSGGLSSSLNSRSAPAIAVSAWLYCVPRLVIGEKNMFAMNRKPTRSPNCVACDGRQCPRRRRPAARRR